jgi:DNA-binding transcriptional LysR family regulator
MRDLNIDQIKKLWILDLIVRSGSLKQAALQAGISPSAVSQTLTALERTVGKPLIVRGRGTFTATSQAFEILGAVRPAFEAFSKLRDLNKTPAPKLAWLNFGTYESIAVSILPAFLNSLRTKMPNIRLALRISRTPALLSMIRKGELCSAMVTEFDDMNGFYSASVAEDRLGVFVSGRHPIASSGWRAIEKFGYGTLAGGSRGLPRYFSKYLRQLDLPKPLVTSDSFETLRAAAIAGSIAAVLPRRVAMRSEGLVEIAPPKPIRESGLHRILVASKGNCDRQEADFLAEEARLHFQTT